jgi:hypothetical protein
MLGNLQSWILLLSLDVLFRNLSGKILENVDINIYMRQNIPFKRMEMGQ